MSKPGEAPEKLEEALSKWAQEYLRNWRPRTPEELRKGREAFERAWANRVDIRPLTTTQLIRELRDGEDEDADAPEGD